MQGTFFNLKEVAEGCRILCAAFIISSLDPVIDIDYTIREKASIQFNDYTLNNDFTSDGIINYGKYYWDMETLLRNILVFPSEGSLTTWITLL